MSLLLLPSKAPSLVHSISGGDLSSYAEELAEFRRNRSIDLRRSMNLCKTRVCKPKSRFYVAPKKSNTLIDACLTFTVESVVSALTSGVDASIVSICQDLCESAPKCPKIVQNMITISDVQEAFVAALDSETSAVGTVLNTIAQIFKLAGETQEAFVDGGLTCSLMNLLSQEDPATISEAINLIGVLSEESSYARDSIICLGIHTILVETAGNHKQTDLATLACESVHKIFSNPDPIESEIVKEAIPSIIEIIEGQSDETMSFILQILVDISSKHPSSVFIYYNLGLYDQIVGFIQNQALTKEALKLAGNMAVAQPLQIICLLDNGLLAALEQLSVSDYLADVFWVYSNLLESYPEGIFELIDEKFINFALDAAEDSPYEVKQEASFFIATMVVFSGNPRASLFFNERVFSVLADVIGCGVNTVALRCLDAFNTFLGYANLNEKQDELLGLVHEMC